MLGLENIPKHPYEHGRNVNANIVQKLHMPNILNRKTLIKSVWSFDKRQQPYIKLLQPKQNIQMQTWIFVNILKSCNLNFKFECDLMWFSFQAEAGKRDIV